VGGGKGESSHPHSESCTEGAAPESKGRPCPALILSYPHGASLSWALTPRAQDLP